MVDIKTLIHNKVSLQHLFQCIHLSLRRDLLSFVQVQMALLLIRIQMIRLHPLDKCSLFFYVIKYFW